MRGQRRVHLGQQPLRGQRHRLGPPTRAHEGQRADAVGHQVGQQVGGLGGRGAAYRGSLLPDEVGQRRLPQRQRHLAAPGVVGVDDLDRQPGEPLRGDPGVRHRGGGQHEGRVGAVRGAQPAQAPQHQRDVGAEDAAVVVALVDHDVAQLAQEPRPAGVPGQHRVVEHVGVGQQPLGVVAGPLPLLRRAVPVVGHGGQPREAQRGQASAAGRWPAPWWARGRARWRPGRPLGRRAPRTSVSAGSWKATRLAGGRPGGQHDVASGVRRLGRAHLVAPRLDDAALAQRRDHGRVRPRRPGGGDPVAWPGRSRRAAAGRCRVDGPPRGGRSSEAAAPPQCRNLHRQRASRGIRVKRCRSGVVECSARIGTCPFGLS